MVFVALMFAASSARAQEPDTLFRLTLASAVIAHSMDLAETMHCRGALKCTEANPWLARFSSPSGFAIAKMSIATASLWATAKLRETHRNWALAANLAQTVGFAAIAMHNAKVSR